MASDSPELLLPGLLLPGPVWLLLMLLLVLMLVGLLLGLLAGLLPALPLGLLQLSSGVSCRCSCGCCCLWCSGNNVRPALKAIDCVRAHARATCLWYFSSRSCRHFVGVM